MGAPTKYTDEHCAIAEQLLSAGKSKAAVCAQFSIARCTLYEWMDEHPEFKKAINSGLQKCQAYWEEIGETGITGQYEKFNGAPWIFTMKNRFREDYAEEKEAKPGSEILLDKLLDRLVD